MAPAVPAGAIFYVATPNCVQIISTATMTAKAISMPMKKTALSPNLSQRIIAGALCALIGWSATAALAKSSDRDEPLYATADKLTADDKTRVSVFTGNVVITKGTIEIRADRFEVREDADGNQIGVATVTGDKNATFSQDRDIPGEVVKGQAKRIDYFSANQSIELTGDAQMRRFRDGQIADETMGHTIRYNSDDGKFFVVGKAGTKGTGDGRVRAVIAPRAKPVPAEK